MSNCWKSHAVAHLVSLRPNYFIFIGYLKTGDGWEGGGVKRTSETPLDPPLERVPKMLGGVKISTYKLASLLSFIYK